MAKHNGKAITVVGSLNFKHKLVVRLIMVRSKHFMKGYTETHIDFRDKCINTMTLEMFSISDFKIIEAILTSSGIVSRIQELTC